MANKEEVGHVLKGGGGHFTPDHVAGIASVAHEVDIAKSGILILIQMGSTLSTGVDQDAQYRNLSDLLVTIQFRIPGIIKLACQLHQYQRGISKYLIA